MIRIDANTALVTIAGVSRVVTIPPKRGAK